MMNRAKAHISRTASGPPVPYDAANARRFPRQQRAQETVAAILTAAAEIMAAEGLARTTTNRIAKRAGVSIGSLYQYFANKEAILGRLLAEHHADVAAIGREALRRLRDPERSPRGAFAYVFEEIVRLHRRKPELYRLLAQREADPSFSHDAAAPGDTELAAELAAALARRPEVVVPDLRTAAHVVLQTMHALGRWLVHDLPVGLDRSAAADEAVRLVCGYLGLESDGRQ
jgi:AcrR family transcriptional regulator